MKSYLYALGCALLSTASFAQNIPSHVQEMKTAYAASGSIVVLDDQTLVIEPNMPGPMCALPRNEGGKTSWSYYAFPLASITVPLAAVDESLIGEDLVFSDPDAAKAYKPGDVGDTTLVVISGVPGKQFHAVTYDREKYVHLGAGPHSGSDYDKTQDNVMAFGLTFTDHAAARSFERAFRNAVLLAKAQALARPHTETTN